MKRFITIALILLNALFATAGDWKKAYGRDEFGDIDYNSPGFICNFEPQGGYGASVSIIFSNGNFGLQLKDAHEMLNNARSIKIKSAKGNVYDIGFDLLDDGTVIIDFESSPMFVELLDKGNFGMSVKTPRPFSNSFINHFFKVGKQTTGIRDLLESTGWMFPPMHEEL